MPVATIPLAEMNRYLGQDLGAERLETLLDQLGCDVEEFTEIRRIKCRYCSSLQELARKEDFPGTCPECGAESTEPETLWEDLGLVEAVRMDLLPVRPDLFDPGGLARAIRGLLEENVGLANYDVAPAVYSVEIDDAMNTPASYRPHIRCAVVRGLALDDISLRQIMKLQEALHWALGRDRKLASIGVYDLSTISERIRYTSCAPYTFQFVPLQSPDGKPHTAREILEKHPKGMAYRHLLADLERFPLLIDDKDQVLAMPPIINSHETRVTLATRDVFIDVTGLGERAVVKSLNTIVTSLIELCPGATAEAVEMIAPSGSFLSPDLAPESFSLDVNAAARLIGIPLDTDKAIELLRQMRHEARPETEEELRSHGVHDVAVEGQHLRVKTAAYRNDIMHEVDLFEDIAMAYGYPNIVPSLVPSMTVAQERPERVIANRARQALVGLGFYEAMSLMLTNQSDHYDLLGVTDPGDAVLLENPVSSEQTMLRTSLLPALLKMFALNRGQGLPQRFFEVEDVVRYDPAQSHEPEEFLHLAAGLLATQAGFADAKALVECVGRELGLSLSLSAAEHPAFLPGRTATVYADGAAIGVCGEVHPAVLERLRLVTPLVALELNLQPLVDEKLS